MYEYNAIINSVHDGDSIRCSVDLGMSVWVGNIPLRLLGIDAPELGKPGGIDARDYLRTMLGTGQAVTIRTVKDETEKYGRLLAVIHTEHDDVSVNQHMLDAGHAVPYDGGKR